MSTTQDLITLVRDITDLDNVDLPNSLITQYLKDGFQRIVALERRWPMYETSYSFNTVADQSTQSRLLALATSGRLSRWLTPAPPATAFS